MNPDAPHYVYRLFDVDDRLLYVGATHDVESRLFHLLHPCNVGKVPGLTADVVSRHTATVYANRRAAFAAEKAAIKAERPLLNRQSAAETRLKAERRMDSDITANAPSLVQELRAVRDALIDIGDHLYARGLTDFSRQLDREEHRIHGVESRLADWIESLPTERRSA